MFYNSICIIFFQADEAVNWFQKRLRNAISYGLSIDDYKMFGKILLLIVQD